MYILWVAAGVPHYQPASTEQGNTTATATPTAACTCELANYTITGIAGRLPPARPAAGRRCCHPRMPQPRRKQNAYLPGAEGQQPQVQQ